MQGIILTGGQGTRLRPLTEHTNKHLLDICGRPMIYYSLSIFQSAGVTDITLITNPQHTEPFETALAGEIGKPFKPLRIIGQKEKPGIAGSIQMMPKDVRVGPYMVVLGDNLIGGSVQPARDRFEKKPDSALILLAQVQHPKAFGVAHMEDGKITNIEEKPKNPDSHWVITGIYFFPKDLFEMASRVRPSARGEYEVTDLLYEYLEEERLEYQMLDHWWVDAGTYKSLEQAKKLVAEENAKNAKEKKA
jgi:glucose-1-phosphate thymidylyltransferase